MRAEIETELSLIPIRRETFDAAIKLTKDGEYAGCIACFEVDIPD